MRLVNNWRTVLLRAWSVRFVALAAVVEFVTNFGPTLIGLAAPEWVRHLVVVFLVLAVGGRVLAQRGVTNADQ